MSLYEHISEINLARAAAYIDGEGCIMLLQSGYKRLNDFRTVRICVTQADPRLPLWFKDLFGGCISTGKGTNRPVLHWMIEGKRAVDILERCLPYLIVKQEQAELAIAYRRTVTEGRKPMSPEVVATRKNLAQKLFNLKHPHKAVPVQEESE